MIDREVDYHIRCLIFATFATLAVAIWDHGRTDDVLKEIALSGLLFWLAGLSLMWWRGIDGPISELTAIIKSLLERINHGTNRKPPD